MEDQDLQKLSMRTISIIVSICAVIGGAALGYIKTTNITREEYFKNQISIEKAIRESISENLKPLSEEVSHQGKRLEDIIRSVNSIEIKLNSGLFLPTREFVQFKEKHLEELHSIKLSLLNMQKENEHQKEINKKIEDLIKKIEKLENKS